MPRAFTVDEQVLIRKRLLKAGRTALAATGFRKTTVSQLAKAAGISKGGFYLFFSDKRALWMEILQAAEAETRSDLEEIMVLADLQPADRIRGLLRVIFDAVTTHPMLRALADPEDLAWLMRNLPEGVLDAARADDDRYFGALYARLTDMGAVGGKHLETFKALPSAALALVLGRGVIGEDRFESCVEFQIESWIGQLVSS